MLQRDHPAIFQKEERMYRGSFLSMESTFTTSDFKLNDSILFESLIACLV